MALHHKLEKEEIDIVNYFYSNDNEDAKVIFDVGCNRGLYVDLFLGRVDNSRIHCFEPIVSLFNDLVSKYSNTEHVILNNVCVSDDTGKIIFCELTDPITDGCSSIIERPVFKERGWEYKKYEVESTTIDNYCRINEIDYINFLKIDVEGAEFLALKGCKEMLKSKSIGMIQFEYGNTFEDANIELKDVYKLIDQYGYGMFFYKNKIFNKVDLNNVEEYGKIDLCNFIIK